MKNIIYAKNIRASIYKPKKCEIISINGITYIGGSNSIKEYSEAVLKNSADIEQIISRAMEVEKMIEYDAFSIKEDILLRYIKLGEILDKMGIVDKFYSNSECTCMIESLDDLKDDSFEYFTSPENKELIDNSILDFVNDFGLVGVNDIQDYFWGVNSLGELDNFTISIIAEPISLIVNDICCFYSFVKHANPEYDMDFDIKVSLYCNQNKVWKSEYVFKSLWHLIRYSLVSTLTSDGEGLRQCPQCNSWFIPSNPKAEYCSAACRNRYNVYKCRKAKKENQ
ncbi:hypothetical protein [Ruminiclostridium cellulolyticum]|uniref:CGNR zinc finger domain-containing protein n=1 Tax=Ruminiclostridium cellulolyticum (strain ATCC 35319 / DSM 5812 / JCM 6584 / H10) TaxID=394503 RepID=B8I353_RUMCH|nr:hypothetical protein [Ruminiclostridium cellulolyticum]ACL76196.1 hypothetical protein Ccel_1848 [Ruminiclostridium cellulolyticum H10]